MSPLYTDTPVLPDEWSTEPVLLDGPVERGAFPPFMMAMAALIIAFVLFQVVISPLAIVVLLLVQGHQPAELLAEFEVMLQVHARTLLSANTIGQVLGLALPAFVLTRLSSSRVRAFMRIRRVDLGYAGLALLGVVALVPLVQWLGTVNELLPIPEALRQFEQSQIEMIETILRIDTGLLFNLTVLAITPAFCEEFLFRGYIQRQAERGIGVAGGILFSGIIFGLYHLRLSQVIPLSILGIYLAYLAWRTGSIWPAIIVHFANNAIAVIVADYVRRREDLSMDALDGYQIPWYLVVGGAIIFVAVLAVLHQHAAARAEENAAERVEQSRHPE